VIGRESLVLREIVVNGGMRRAAARSLSEGKEGED